MNKLFSITVLAVILFFWSGCRPEKFEEIGEPFNKVQALNGSWKLTQVVQTDLLAQSYNYQDPSRPDVNLVSMDVTNVAPYTDFGMTLNVQGADTTFTTTPSNSPNILRFANGKLLLNDATAPSNLRFVNGADTLRMDIGNYSSLNLSNILTLSVIRTQAGKPVLRYDYKFSKN